MRQFPVASVGMLLVTLSLLLVIQTPPPAEAFFRDDGEVNRAKITFNHPEAGNNLVVRATLDEPANEQIRFVAKVVPCEKNLCGSDAQATVDATTSSDFERRVYYNSVADRDANGNTSVDGKWGADGDNPIYWFYSTRYIIINEGQSSGTAEWETQTDSDTASESFLVSVSSLSGPKPDYYLGWPHPLTPNVGNCGFYFLSYCYKAQIVPPGTTKVSILQFPSTINEGQTLNIVMRVNPAPTGSLSFMYSLAEEGDYITDKRLLGTQTFSVSGSITSIPLSTTHDNVPNPHGSITFTLLPGNGYVPTGQTSVTIPVEDIDGWQPPQNSPPGDFLIGQVPEVEGEGEPEDPPQPKQLRQEQPQQPDSFKADQTLISNIKEYAAETYRGQEHVDRWHRVLKTFGVEEFPGLTTMTSEEAYTYVQQGWNRWIPVVAELKVFETWQEQQQPPQPEQPPQQEQQPIPVNLVSNGSFEAPIVTEHNGQWQQFAPSTAGISWTVTGDSLEIQRGILGGASDGSQHAELDAQGSVTISQTLNTVSGQAYEISFDYKARPNTASNTNGMNVTWNGVDIAPNLTLAKTWQTYTVNATGTGSDTISFADAGTSDGIGTFLDNVSVMRTGSPLQ